jgi:hypothetical protein
MGLIMWVHLALVFFCTRFAISELRKRDDWGATICIVSVLLNLAALIVRSLNS